MNAYTDDMTLVVSLENKNEFNLMVASLEMNLEKMDETIEFLRNNGSKTVTDAANDLLSQLLTQRTNLKQMIELLKMKYKF